MLRGECGKNGIDPGYAYSANSQNGYHHRNEGIAESPYGAGKNVHKTAGEIGESDYHHTVDTVAYLRRLAGKINTKKRVSENIGDKPHTKAHREYKSEIGKHYLFQLVVAACPHILSRKSKGGLVEGVHCNEDKAFNVGGGGVTCHYLASEGVDGGLNDNVGKGEEKALYSRGNADFQNFYQLVGVNSHLRRNKSYAIVDAHKVGNYKKGGDYL